MGRLRNVNIDGDDVTSVNINIETPRCMFKRIVLFVNNDGTVSLLAQRSAHSQWFTLGVPDPKRFTELAGIRGGGRMTGDGDGHRLGRGRGHRGGRYSFSCARPAMAVARS
jgi:hypothetical protein